MGSVGLLMIFLSFYNPLRERLTHAEIPQIISSVQGAATFHEGVPTLKY